MTLNATSKADPCITSTLSDIKPSPSALQQLYDRAFQEFCCSALQSQMYRAGQTVPLI